MEDPRGGIVGLIVGDAEGVVVGPAVVGVNVGSVVGVDVEGLAVGTDVGVAVGAWVVGCTVGANVGTGRPHSRSKRCSVQIPPSVLKSICTTTSVT